MSHTVCITDLSRRLSSLAFSLVAIGLLTGQSTCTVDEELTPTPVDFTPSIPPSPLTPVDDITGTFELSFVAGTDCSSAANPWQIMHIPELSIVSTTDGLSGVYELEPTTNVGVVALTDMTLSRMYLGGAVYLDQENATQVLLEGGLLSASTLACSTTYLESNDDADNASDTTDGTSGDGESAGGSGDGDGSDTGIPSGTEPDTGASQGDTGGARLSRSLRTENATAGTVIIPTLRVQASLNPSDSGSTELSGEARVIVVSDTGMALEGATVRVQFSGPVNEVVEGITENGMVILNTSPVLYPAGTTTDVTLTATVIEVVDSQYVLDQSHSVMMGSDSKHIEDRSWNMELQGVDVQIFTMEKPEDPTALWIFAYALATTRDTLTQTNMLDSVTIHGTWTGSVGGSSQTASSSMDGATLSLSGVVEVHQEDLEAFEGELHVSFSYSADLAEKYGWTQTGGSLSDETHIDIRLDNWDSFLLSKP